MCMARRAVVILASPNTWAHSLKLRLVVMIVDRRQKGNLRIYSATL